MKAQSGLCRDVLCVSISKARSVVWLVHDEGVVRSGEWNWYGSMDLWNAMIRAIDIRRIFIGDTTIGKCYLSLNRHPRPWGLKWLLVLAVERSAWPPCIHSPIWETDVDRVSIDARIIREDFFGSILGSYNTSFQSRWCERRVRATIGSHVKLKAWNFRFNPRTS